MTIQQISRAILQVLPMLAFTGASAEDPPRFAAELVFPLHPQHNHAPGIVECPNGDLLVSWYRGSGERNADDVAVYGARRRHGQSQWSEPFVMADTPGFPDGNTTMFIDRRGRLWLFWPIVLANTWESCVTSYRVASQYEAGGSPRWEWQSPVLLKPEAFVEEMEKGLETRLKLAPVPAVMTNRLPELKGRIADKLAQRLGWQPRCKPTVLRSGRILLPLYSDTYSVSIMAVSDDEGQTWFASRPLAGYGNIQPAVLQKSDGTLVAYMRENGPLNRVRVAESSDEGISWGPVGVTELANPGSGLDALRLSNGHWLLVYNDTTRGRHRLAVSLSEDEGKSWKWTRHLENESSGSFHYPAIIQGRDGTLHVIYSYFVAGGKSMKHAAFNEAWVKAVVAGKGE
ncbi:MAG: neuraminidase (sialidase)-like protein [Verrucomicrobia bacterium]|nr:MAG: neuraminidase (sialidase)-like protein [Verrucomicrobiota bacterium]